MVDIIGREDEKKKLDSILQSPDPSFLVVYGRRRIGKTFLIREFFRPRGIFFHLTGVQGAKTSTQLRHFEAEFSDCFLKGRSVDKPKDWTEAMQQLRRELEHIDVKTPVILFFDELPWLCSARSGFLPALDHLWNRYLSSMPNVTLIVCGSAASWMIDNVLNSKGGLHGRTTHQMRLAPFTLKETENFLLSRDIRLDRKQIIELYLCFGGVPHYLAKLERGQSVAQLVGKLCFSYNAPLLSEFHKLYRSLFEHYENHVKIVEVLSTRRFGLSYEGIVKQTGLSSGGGLSKKLVELIESGFVAKLPIFDAPENEWRYVLVDEFSLFYLQWMRGVTLPDLGPSDGDYWQRLRNRAVWLGWAGHAFELTCWKHVLQIKAALGLSAVQTYSSKWIHSSKGALDGAPGAEIDLVIDRADQCINLIEIKFYNERWVFKKSDGDALERKRACFERITGTKKATFSTVLSTYGIKENTQSLRAVDRQLDMMALFQS